jgi:hypothetical protein
MTRAKDISKIVTDADLSGTLDVTGTVTANELVVSQETPKITITDTGTGSDHELNGASSIGNLTLNFDKNDDGSSPYFYIQHASTKLAAFRKGGDISFFEDTGTTAKFFWDASAERLGVGTSSPSHELTVAGSADTRVTIDGSNSAGLYISDSGANGITIRNTNDGDLEFLTVGGKEVVFNQLSVDTDFRVESDNNTHALFVQGSNGNVGLGLTAPSRKLSIYDATNPYIALYDGSSGTAIADGFQVQFASTNAYLWNYENGFTAFGTNASERMRITSGGNVGIGNSNPEDFGSLVDNLVVGTTSGDNGITIASGTGNGGRIQFADNTASPFRGAFEYDHSSDAMIFYTNGSGRMRIDSSGNILFGTTALPSNGTGHAGFETGQSNGRTILQLGTTTTSQETVQRFYNPNGNVGEIKLSGTSTSYVTTSDYRLKENVTADWDATTRLKQLNPVRFNFIADADTTVDGFLAHEVQSVVPEAITGTHNEVDADGNPVYQGIDQSKLVPLLVKTIQELEARIVALETA